MTPTLSPHNFILLFRKFYEMSKQMIKCWRTLEHSDQLWIFLCLDFKTEHDNVLTFWFWLYAKLLKTFLWLKCPNLFLSAWFIIGAVFLRISIISQCDKTGFGALKCVACVFWTKFIKNWRIIEWIWKELFSHKNCLRNFVLNLLISLLPWRRSYIDRNVAFKNQ